MALLKMSSVLWGALSPALAVSQTAVPLLAISLPSIRELLLYVATLCQA